MEIEKEIEGLKKRVEVLEKEKEKERQRKIIELKNEITRLSLDVKVMENLSPLYYSVTSGIKKGGYYGV